MSDQLSLLFGLGDTPTPPRPLVDETRGMHRRDDLDTSVGAAIIALKSLGHHRHLALMALYEAGDDGLNDFELEAVTGVVQASIGKRRGELRDDGLVRRAFTEDGKSVKRPSSTTGSPSAVWCLTAAGYLAAGTVEP